MTASSRFARLRRARDRRPGRQLGTRPHHVRWAGRWQPAVLDLIGRRRQPAKQLGGLGAVEVNLCDGGVFDE
jgi:hypothetical protein